MQTPSSPSQSNPLLALKEMGQSVWLDNLSRKMLQTGTLQRFIQEDGVSGVTSNPSIFQKALSDSDLYEADLARLRGTESDPERRYEALVIPDIQAACDLFRPVYDATHGDDGYVSLEVSPQLAQDVDATVQAGRRFYQHIQRDNLLIKVPATPAGITAFEELVAGGYKLNVTLMFSLGHVHGVFDAYVRGLRRWVAGNGDPRQVKAVASLFMSRVDTLVDKKLTDIGSPEALSLRGKAAVAMGKLAYQYYLSLFHGPDFADLRAAGARPMYLLWASTGTKNPAYNDTLYVETLIGSETINTMPDSTLAAFRDHGHVGRTVTEGVEDAQKTFDMLGRLGIDMEGEIARQLQQEGLKIFEDSFSKLLGQMD